MKGGAGNKAEQSSRARKATARPARPARPAQASLKPAAASRGSAPARPGIGEVVVVEDFLSVDECERILYELKFARWLPSLTYTPQRDGSYKDVLSTFRVSESAQQSWFSDDLQAILKGLEKRLKALYRVDSDRLEYWQATSYREGGKFDYHLDSGYWSAHHAAERIFTFLLYLNTPKKGGGTHFRALDRYIEGRAGRLIVWANLFENGDANHQMIHSSVPLLKGRKTTLVTWFRQKKFRIAKAVQKR